MTWRVLLVAAAIAISLRGELLPIRAYSTADGLASDHIDCILPDSRGFLWICTPEGLSRFDGYRFTNYTADDGLPHNAVTAVLETRSGALLVGTRRGIARIDPTGHGSRWSAYTPEHEPAANSVTALYESRDGKIWCATRRALFEWDGAGSFRRRELPLAPLEEIADLTEDQNGVVWIATSAGVRVLDGHAERTLLAGTKIGHVLAGAQGRMWVTADDGVALIEQGRVTKRYGAKSGLAGHFATTLAESPDETLWIGTDWGISRLRLGAAEPLVLNNIRREQGLTDRQINAVAIDQATASPTDFPRTACGRCSKTGTAE